MSNDLPSAETSPNEQISKEEVPVFQAVSSCMDTTELHHAPEGLIETNVGDYSGINNFQDVKNVVIVESSKLWSIASPICFGILCNYAINTFTNIFVGHLGDLELTSVSISLSVVSNFSFGFMVSFFCLFGSFLMYFLCSDTNIEHDTDTNMLTTILILKIKLIERRHIFNKMC